MAERPATTKHESIGTCEGRDFHIKKMVPGVGRLMFKALDSRRRGHGKFHKILEKPAKKRCWLLTIMEDK
jgi:hypothetical protein